MSLLEGYRLFTGYYIYESEELASEAKLEFVQFLKEASADDIIDILSGQYEGVEGLTEDEMEAVNTFLEGKFSSVGKKIKGVGSGIKKHLGYERLAAAKAAKKGNVVGVDAKKFTTKTPYGGVTPGERAKGMKGAKKEYGKALRGAVGRTALATTAVGGAGYGGYKAKSRKK